MYVSTVRKLLFLKIFKKNYDVHQAKTWKNLLVADPFSLPDTVVVLEIPGLKNPGFNLKYIEHHKLITDEPLVDVYNTVKQIIKQRLENEQYSLIYGSLTNDEFVREFLISIL